MIYLDANRSNEVKAREGIDTRHHGPLVHTILGSNEVKAREGIDTTSSISHHFTPSLCSNEVKAREGIDTTNNTLALNNFFNVAMRLKPVRALTPTSTSIKSDLINQ